MDKTQLKTLIIFASINLIVAILFLISYFLTVEFLYLMVSFVNFFALIVVYYLVIRLHKKLKKSE